MSPGTNIGAASPIASGGQDLPETLAKKINEDTRAFIRSIAQTKGRNSKALEETVTLARSYSAREALELNVVDLIASDLPDLLRQIDGKSVITPRGTQILNTKDLEIRELHRNLLEDFLGVITNPNLVFLFLTIGGLGILAELMTPGLKGPGVIGAIALALGFVGAGQMPVNWVGVGLILLAMVLFYLETQEGGLGIFIAGGVVSFISEPSLKVSSWLIGGAGSLMVLSALVFGYLMKPTGSSSGNYTGIEPDLVGKRGVVIADVSPTGKVLVDGQEWTATTKIGDVILEKEEVTVMGVYGTGVLVVSTQPP